LIRTHYFELTSLAGEAPGVVNVHVEAVEHARLWCSCTASGKVRANQSYGLQVAALAGIPKSVTAQARRYLTELERERDALANLHLTASRTRLVRPRRRHRRHRNPRHSSLRALDPNS